MRWWLPMLLVLAACPRVERDRCDGVDCGAGRCLVDRGSATCVCDSGFVAEGLACNAIDACSTEVCAVTGARCIVENGAPSCQCPSDRVLDRGACVPRSPCLPNPCTDARMLCDVVANAARCSCPPGFVPEGSACSQTAVWSCEDQHQEAGVDQAEPDECPALASPIALGVELPRSIFGAGDSDWFSVPTVARAIMHVEVHGEVALLLEIFDADGLRVLAADTHALHDASVDFVAPAAVAFVRVRALSAAETGAYTLAASQLGFDDFTDDATLAVGVSPSTMLEGDVQFSGDRDRVWLELPGQTAVWVELVSQSALTLELTRDDGASHRISNGESMRVTAPTDARWLLTVAGRSALDVGAYRVNLTIAGADDHSDTPAFATVIRVDGQSLPGELEDARDLDAWTFTATAPHVYRVRWRALTGNSLQAVDVLDANGGAIVRSQSGASQLAFKARVTEPVSLVVRDAMTDDQPGHYTLAVDDLGLDDFPDDEANARSAALGVPIVGRLDFLDDLDVFAVDIPPGHVLRAQVSSLQSPGASVAVIDPRRNMSPRGESAALLVDTAGTSFVVVRGSSNELVNYTLAITDDGADDHGDTPATATRVPLGTQIVGRTSYASDVDLLAFTPTVGHVYRLDSSLPLPTTNLAALDPTLAQRSFTWWTAPQFFASVGGTWFVRVTAPPLGSWTVQIIDLGLEDHSEDTSSATLLTIGARQRGVLGFDGDRDTFVFDAEAQRIYTATVDAGITDFSLAQLDASGAVRLETRSAQGTMTFSAESAGPAWLMVRNTLPQLVPYELSVTRGGLDDFPNSAANAVAISRATDVAGQLDFGTDVDAFRVPLVAGHHHRIRCDAGASICALTLTDLAGLELRSSDSGGNVVDEFCRGSTALAEVVVLVNGLQFTGSYVLRVDDLGPDDVGDDAASAERLVRGVTVNRAFETPADVDAFVIAANASEVLHVDCLDCAVSVVTPSGARIANALPGFRAASAGDYVLFVSGQGPYALTVSPRPDDHGDDAAHATPITLSVLNLGRTDYTGDVDAFSLSLAIGDRVYFEPAVRCTTQLRNPNDAVVPISGITPVFITATLTGQYTFLVRNCLTPGDFEFSVQP
ncbi:MAG: EB domain-containing protein [Archangium sp.]